MRKKGKKIGHELDRKSNSGINKEEEKRPP